MLASMSEPTRVPATPRPLMLLCPMAARGMLPSPTRGLRIQAWSMRVRCSLTLVLTTAVWLTLVSLTAVWLTPVSMRD